MLVQRLGAPGDPEEWGVYEPLRVLPLGVTCHGEAETCSPELREVLARAYPQDQPTGYSDGDWLGLIRVSVRPAGGA